MNNNGPKWNIAIGRPFLQIQKHAQNAKNQDLPFFISNFSQISIVK